MKQADFLFVGGGIAGLSAAARLARHGSVTVLEAEASLGFHSSGRSVTFSHLGIGNDIVRGLTAYSRAFFESSPPDFCEVPLYRRQASLYVATEPMLPQLRALDVEMARFTSSLRALDAQEIAALFPIVRTGAGEVVAGIMDSSGLKLDADALLQSFGREVRKQGGEIVTGQRIASVSPAGNGWRVRTDAGETWSAPVLVNAAGAWADHVAAMAGVRPLGLQPMRRTIIVLDPPSDADISDWPFLHTAANDFYMLPEAGRLLASPVDEVPSDPCDAQPEEYDIALTAAKVEEYTTLGVRWIAHSWAGLRSFVADRVPTAGSAPDAPGFFWLAGQGGYGLQTAPAMAEIVEALIVGAAWPERLSALGVSRENVEPGRLLAAKA